MTILKDWDTSKMTPTGAVFTAYSKPDSPPVLPGIYWQPRGNQYVAYQYNRRPAAPVGKKIDHPEMHPIPQKSSGGGGGGGGHFSSMWNDYVAQHERLGMDLIGEIGGIQNQAKADFNRVMKGFQGVQKTAKKDYGLNRKLFDTDIANLPSLSMRLPGMLGGGDIPLAPGKFQQMASNILNSRNSTTGAKLQTVLAGLTGEGQAADSKAARGLQGAGLKGGVISDMMGGKREAIGSQQSYDLGLKGLENQMNIASGGWANNLALQNLQNKQSSYDQQQRLNAVNDNNGSDWLIPTSYLVGKGFDWAANNWDKVQSGYDTISGWLGGA